MVTETCSNKNGVLCGCSADTYSHVLYEWPIKDGPSGNVVEAQGSTVEQRYLRYVCMKWLPSLAFTSIRLHLFRQIMYSSPNCLQLVGAVPCFKGRPRNTGMPMSGDTEYGNMYRYRYIEETHVESAVKGKARLRERPAEDATNVPLAVRRLTSGHGQGDAANRVADK